MPLIKPGNDNPDAVEENRPAYFGSRPFDYHCSYCLIAIKCPCRALWVVAGYAALGRPEDAAHSWNKACFSLSQSVSGRRDPRRRAGLNHKPLLDSQSFYFFVVFFEAYPADVCFIRVHHVAPVIQHRQFGVCRGTRLKMIPDQRFRPGPAGIKPVLPGQLAHPAIRNEQR